MTDWDEFENDGRASYTEPVDEEEDEPVQSRAPAAAAAAAAAAPEKPMFILEKIPYQAKGLKVRGRGGGRGGKRLRWRVRLVARWRVASWLWSATFDG